MLAYALCTIVHFDVDIICTYSMHLKNTALKVNVVQVKRSRCTLIFLNALHEHKE